LVVRLERTEGAGVRRYEGEGRRGERQRDMGNTRNNWQRIIIIRLITTIIASMMMLNVIIVVIVRRDLG